MAYVVADRVFEQATTTGTGAFTLAGAATGYRAFSAVCAVADTVPYVIEAVDSNGVPTGDWETGIGTYSGSNTLTRSVILASSNAGSAVNFAAGVKNVFLSVPSGVEQTLFLVSDATNSSNTTPSNVSGFSFAAAANASYEIDVIGLAQSAATTTGLGLALDTPASPVFVAGIGLNAGSTSGTPVTFVSTGDDAITVVSTSMVAANTNSPVWAKFLLTNGSNSGTVQLRLRSEINGSQVTLKAGTMMRVRRIG